MSSESTCFWLQYDSSPPPLHTHTQLCLFAEGTRFTPEKHEVSKEFARSRGLPVLKHHLIPRTKGFNFIMKHMEGTCKHTEYIIRYGSTHTGRQVFI